MDDKAADETGLVSRHLLSFQPRALGGRNQTGTWKKTSQLLRRDMNLVRFSNDKWNQPRPDSAWSCCQSATRKSSLLLS